MSAQFTRPSNGHEPSGPGGRQPGGTWSRKLAASAMPGSQPESEGPVERRGHDPAPEFESGASEALMDTYNG